MVEEGGALATPQSQAIDVDCFGREAAYLMWRRIRGRIDHIHEYATVMYICVREHGTMHARSALVKPWIAVLPNDAVVVQARLQLHENHFPDVVAEVQDALRLQSAHLYIQVSIF